MNNLLIWFPPKYCKALLLKNSDAPFGRSILASMIPKFYKEMK